jgi:hypothetical protein
MYYNFYDEYFMKAAYLKAKRLFYFIKRQVRRGLKIGEILRARQPGVYKKLNEKPKKKSKERKGHLSFSYVQNDLMSHDSFSRHRGAISQKRWGK